MRSQQELPTDEWHTLTDEQKSQWERAADRNFAGGDPSGYEYQQMVTEQRQRQAAKERARNSYGAKPFRG